MLIISATEDGRPHLLREVSANLALSIQLLSALNLTHSCIDSNRRMALSLLALDSSNPAEVLARTTSSSSFTTA